MENDHINDDINDDINDAKRHLIDELSNEQSNINVLRIRNICRDYPGIISTTGLRLRIWSLLLLGQEDASIEQGIIYLYHHHHHHHNHRQQCLYQHQRSVMSSKY